LAKMGLDVDERSHGGCGAAGWDKWSWFYITDFLADMSLPMQKKTPGLI
jgi:hypothetical protein